MHQRRNGVPPEMNNSNSYYNTNTPTNNSYNSNTSTDDEYDMFGNRTNSNPTTTSTSTSNSTSQSKKGNKRLQNKSRTSVYAILLIFLINVIILFTTRGVIDVVIYLFLAVLVGGLRGYSKLPKRYMTAIGIFLLCTPICLWCWSFFSGILTSNSNDSSSVSSTSTSTATSATAATTSSYSSTKSTSATTSSGTTESVLIPVYSTILTNQPLTIHCPPRAVISSIDFVSYGTPSSCIGWKATKNCKSDGPRDNSSDLNCDQVVPAARSGYCQCSDGTKRVSSNCNHPTFTCQQECERVVHCNGFRSTTNCDPHKGGKSSTLLPCDHIVPPHISGYCECDNGTNVAHSTCDHDPFTCEDACTKGTARWPPFVINKECHHEKSSPIIEHQCATGRTSCSLAAGWPESLFEYDEHQGNHDPCPNNKNGQKRRLHVRLTCSQRRVKKVVSVTVGEICRSTTDAFKLCMEHHIVAEAIKCQSQYSKVLECQEKAKALGGGSGN